MGGGKIVEPRRRALVRGVPDSYIRCVTRARPRRSIDVARAREQHAIYCNELRAAGFDILFVESDERHPDCVFIEDTAISLGGVFAGCMPGEPTRQGECEPVLRALQPIHPVHRMQYSMDGGDILQIGSTAFVGMSSRTGREAFVEFEQIARAVGKSAVPVAVAPTTLHLKSAVTCAGENLLIAARGEFDEKPFDTFEILAVDERERAFANVLALPDRVLVSRAAPRLAETISKRNSRLNNNITVHVLDISEFEKGDGGLTCLSILIYE